MLIAQISDLHLKPAGTLLFGEVDVFAMAEAAVSRLNALVPRPDAVIVTGDIANDGTQGDYAAAMALLGRIEAPVFPILGNHDRREPAREALRAFCKIPEAGPLCYAADIGQLRIVALDSLVEGEGGGELGIDQLGWLDETLAAAPDRPTLVLVHHPPFETGIGFMDRFGLKDAPALAAIISRHAHVVRMLSGHIHRTIVTAFAGTMAMTAPGIAHHVALDLGPRSKAGWTLEPPGFLLHYWNGAGLVSHNAFVDAGGAPRAFSDDHAVRG